MIKFRYWKPLAAITFWGASFVATKITLQEFSPICLITLRFILGIGFLLVLRLKIPFSLNTTSRERRSLFLLAIFSVLHLWIQVTGLQFTSATNTGWIMGVTPVLMAIMGICFFKERLKVIQIAGIILSFIGLVILISQGDLSRISLLNNKGDFLILASTLTWSIYSAINKQLSLTLSPFTTIFWLFHLMIIILLPFSMKEMIHIPLMKLPISVWVSLLFLGIFCSGWGFVLWAQALQSMPSAHVGIFLYLEPFVTVIVSWIILHENITGLTIVSGLIITTGVILVNLNQLYSVLINERR